MTNASQAQHATGTDHTALLHRLARIEGQLRGVQKLVAQAQAPADYHGIAQQLHAARKAMDGAFMLLVTHALSRHITEANMPDTTTQEARALIGLLETLG